MANLVYKYYKHGYELNARYYYLIFMLTITTVVIMSNCRPANGNNSQNLATTLFIVHSVQSE